jgi:Fur family transcriptional regulator, ferric uptake regulator
LARALDTNLFFTENTKLQTENPMKDRCNFPEILARRRLRPTPLRLKVLETLGSEARAWQVREILAAIQRRRPANKVSIYRILDELTRLGLVRQVSSEGGPAHYELACEHHPPHPHFQCQACGEVQCLEPVPLERIRQELKGPPGNRVDRLEIRAAGLCHKCRNMK